MPISFFSSRAQGHSRALSAQEVRGALSELPGWGPYRYSRRLRGVWRFATAEDAAGFVIAVEAIAFEQGLLPEVHSTGRSVTVILTDPRAEAVTPTVLAFARRLSEVAGLPGGPELGRTAPLVAAVVQELTT